MGKKVIAYHEKNCHYYFASCCTYIFRCHDECFGDTWFHFNGHRQTKRTGYINDTVDYGGNDCVMLDGKLYWNTSQFFMPSELENDGILEQIGIIIAMDDTIPTHNYHSAVSSVGTKIFANSNQPSSIYLLKEINVIEVLAEYTLT